jgi:hypothetical protein
VAGAEIESRKHEKTKARKKKAKTRERTLVFFRIFAFSCFRDGILRDSPKRGGNAPGCAATISFAPGLVSQYDKKVLRAAAIRGEHMSHDSQFIVQLPSDLDKQILMPAAVAPAPPHAVLAHDLEQAKAVEAVFAARERESQAVVGLLGLWTGTMLLNDLAIETFSEPAGEVELDKKKPEDEK